MDDSQLWHFFGVRKDLGGELNIPVVEWLNKGLMSVSNPTKPGSATSSSSLRNDGSRPSWVPRATIFPALPTSLMRTAQPTPRPPNIRYTIPRCAYSDPC
eukprot:9069166-Pyramimonas_sp.AAC.1